MIGYMKEHRSLPTETWGLFEPKKLIISHRIKQISSPYWCKWISNTNTWDRRKVLFHHWSTIPNSPNWKKSVNLPMTSRFQFMTGWHHIEHHGRSVWWSKGACSWRRGRKAGGSVAEKVQGPWGHALVTCPGPSESGLQSQSS